MYMYIYICVYMYIYTYVNIYIHIHTISADAATVPQTVRPPIDLDSYTSQGTATIDSVPLSSDDMPHISRSFKSFSHIFGFICI
jgi:hypothetical protein